MCSNSARVKTCLGLLAFLQGDMSAAAGHLLAVPPALPGASSPLLHADEVALYGVLAALASCGREGLRARFQQASGGGAVVGLAKQHLEQARCL